jgi:hypothetical protein
LFQHPLAPPFPGAPLRRQVEHLRSAQRWLISIGGNGMEQAVWKGSFKLRGVVKPLVFFYTMQSNKDHAGYLDFFSAKRKCTTEGDWFNQPRNLICL